MKKVAMVVIVCAFAGNVYAGKPGGGGCADVPISWVFEATTTSELPSAITDDGKGAYKPGNGVNSVIHFGKDCNGSKDATLALGRRSSRTLSMNFPAAIAGSIIEDLPPDFAGDDPIATQPFLLIYNLIGYPEVKTGATTWYTKFMANYIKGPDGLDYILAFQPFDCPIGLIPCVDSPTPDGDPSSNQNAPVSAAWVKVNYIPASGGTLDQWIVEGEFTYDGDPIVQRGTLLSSGVHRGQYSMPFRIRITALAPLPALP